MKPGSGMWKGMVLRVILLLLFPALVFGQRMSSLSDVDIAYKEQRKLADVRIQAYASSHPDTRINFYANNNVYLLVDVTESGVPVYVKTFNAQAAYTVGVPQLRTGGSLGINILGTGIRLATWDGGKVLGNHVELAGRVTFGDAPSAFDGHATHTSGTMIASGINSSAKGMAPEATLIAYDFNNDVSEMTALAKPDQTGTLLSNHSYGVSAGWEFDGTTWTWKGDPSISATEDYKFGFYDAQSAQWDAIAVNAPYYLIVKAAGNDRGEYNGSGPALPDGGTSGFDCISMYGVAKNILTVGAVNKLFSPYTGPTDVLMTSFSSWGPTDDGRIKPDIVAPGVQLFSSFYDGTSATNVYKSLDGTSMATPTVTGSLALLQQLYKSLNSGNYMRSATLKALAIHTARESGSSRGPDYKFGWGLLNVEGAAGLILNEDNQNIFIQESVLANGQTYEVDLGIPKIGKKITATLVWTDPAATPPAPSLNPTTKMLVNDLDLRLVDDGGNLRFPWTMNPASPNAAADSTKDNFRDNVEKIEFGLPQPRSYKLRVTHKGTLSGGSQPYSLVITYSSQVDPRTTYYWIGNSGNWNDGAHWSLSSGGAAAGVVPGANDRVVFDEQSFTAAGSGVTLTASQSCYSLRWFAKQYAVDFSMGGNTLNIGESLTLITDKITTSTPGTLNFSGTASTVTAIDLGSSSLNQWSLNFNGSSAWTVTGSGSVNQITNTQGTVNFVNATIKINQLNTAGVSVKTYGFTTSTIQALAGLTIDFTGAMVQSDVQSSIIALPSVSNQVTLSSANFQGLVNLQGGDITITGTGQLRSVQGNGILRLNGSLLTSNLSLTGGSQLVLQSGATQTFTDKISFATSAASRVAIKSSSAGNATLGFNSYYLVCMDNVDVQNVDIGGSSVVNAGTGSTLTNSANWLQMTCSSILFPDFSIAYTCQKSATYFTDKSSGSISSRSWNFGDPSSPQNSSTLTSPVHYYAGGGPFSVTLTITGSSGSRSVTKQVTMQANDLPDNTVQTNNGNLISTVLSSSYQWLKDGQIIDGATSRSYNFSGTPGEYSVLI
ncbi:MAG: S8 family serine peptidase, partial [Bacteroidetes bacterium]|nr:S8 family serine peptidase [Bacteroidota bacterium]